MSEDILKKYEERLRAMETEMRKREIDAQRDEAEQAERERRELEDLIERQERALQAAAARRLAAGRVPEQPEPERQDDGLRRLETLQKRMRDREENMNRIRAMLGMLSYAAVQPVPPQPQQPVPPQPQQTQQIYQPPQIAITQNFTSPAVPYAALRECAVTADNGAEAEKPRKPESVATESVVTETVADGERGDGVMYGERLTFAESYVLLSPVQKTYCDGLRFYAAEKSGAKEFPAKYHLCVGNGQKVVIKFVIKNGVTIARFRLEDERLRRLRRSATSDDVEVKIKESELPITDDTAYGVAKQMIDLRITQIAEDAELRKQRAAERRRNKKSD